MLQVQDIINLFLSPDTQIAMGECAYQRLCFCLGVFLPVFYMSFGAVIACFILYAIYKLVVGK
jgi:hypothetical protein